MKLKLKMVKRGETIEGGSKVFTYEMGTAMVEGLPVATLGHLTIHSPEPIPMLKCGAVIDVELREGADIVTASSLVGKA